MDVGNAVKRYGDSAALSWLSRSIRDNTLQFTDYPLEPENIAAVLN